MKFLLFFIICRTPRIFLRTALAWYFQLRDGSRWTPTNLKERSSDFSWILFIGSCINIRSGTWSTSANNIYLVLVGARLSLFTKHQSWKSWRYSTPFTQPRGGRNCYCLLRSLLQPFTQKDRLKASDRQRARARKLRIYWDRKKGGREQGNSAVSQIPKGEVLPLYLAAPIHFLHRLLIFFSFIVCREKKEVLKNRYKYHTEAL